MTTRKKTRRKIRGTSKKKTSKKWRVSFLALALIGLLAVVGIAGYWISSSRSTAPSAKTPLFETRIGQPKPPRAGTRIFEVYPSKGTEAKVKQTDRAIYEALLALNVRVDDVVFKSVSTKRSAKEEWTFSEMEIRVSGKTLHERIRETLSKRLSRVLPTSSVRFIHRAKNKTVTEISVNGRPTHRLIFITTRKETPTVSRQRLPLVAIIVDDLGYDKNMAWKFLELDGIQSFSVLPNSPFQKSIASAIHEVGREVLLHLPMEPLEYPLVDPGGGALLSSMSQDELVDQLERDLDEVPFVVGVNNHMGSKLTQDPITMRWVFSVLKKHKLFFIDSFTNPNSSCALVAERLQLRFARRQVFLDHVQDETAIRFQLKRLLSIAKARGQAIGIAHPYALTLDVLRQELPRINKEANLVAVSKLIDS